MPSIQINIHHKDSYGMQANDCCGMQVAQGESRSLNLGYSAAGLKESCSGELVDTKLIVEPLHRATEQFIDTRNQDAL